MCIVDFGARGSDWDAVMFHLARWLTRHLDDPKLLIWLGKNGGQLHEKLVRLIRNRVEELDKLHSENKQDDLDRIIADAPKAIPGTLMRKLWGVFLSGRLWSPFSRPDLYYWLPRIMKDGVTPSLRIELRKILMPCVTVRRPFRFSEETPETTEPKRVSDIIDWELVLASNHVHSALRDLANKPVWQEMLPDLLPEFTMLLRDALDLKQELGGAEEKSDLSYIHQPSISEHPQNQDFHDWTALVNLTRDAWLATAHVNHARAYNVAEDWWRAPYPIFKRLALFAATQSEVVSTRQALDWLLAEACWWLWSVETQREALRLLVALAPKLKGPEIGELELAILSGPPREMFKEDVDKEEWDYIFEHYILLRLAKLHSAGAFLGKESRTILEQLRRKHPRWQLAENQSDEFPFWMGGDDEYRKFSKSPRQRRELVEWLKEHETPNHWEEDDWRQRCRDDFPTTSCALYALVKEDVWPSDRWREALQAWSEEKLIKRSWRYMGPVLNDASDEFMQSISSGLSYWLRSISKTFEGHETLFLNLCHRILELDYEAEEDGDDIVTRAINHPVGHVTEAFLDWWYRKSLQDDQGLPEEIKEIFTKLCNTQIDKFRYGRVLLSAHTITLYRVDPKWAVDYLLPLFNWEFSPDEARAAWKSFLWSPRLYRPFLSAIKESLLETVEQYVELGKHGKQYAGFLTFVALDPGDVFTVNELTNAIGHLPANGLRESAEALVRALEGSQDQRSEYWHNRVLPFLNNIWPKNRDIITREISFSLARLCVAASESFPEALQILRHSLQSVHHPDSIVHLLCEANLCELFPTEALEFLDAVIGDDAEWIPRELQQCLDVIEQEDQQLTNEAHFIRLVELIRRRGMT